MGYRFATSEELARETTRRILERLAGHGVWRATPWSERWELAVFNPSPHWRSDLVRVALDPHPWFDFSDDAAHAFAVHPLIAASAGGSGFRVADKPARIVNDPESSGMWTGLERPPLVLECFVRDVPPFGCVRLPLEPLFPSVADEEDDARTIDNGRVRVEAEATGTFSVRFASGAEFRGLGGIEDVGDRGDTYDFDPVPGGAVRVRAVRCRRLRHASGVQILEIDRVLRVPMSLDAARHARSKQTVALPLTMRLRLLPDLDRVDLEVEWENTARDHRLRLLFPTGRPARSFLAASTFDIAQEEIARPDDSRWVHPAPRTFPHQGWVHANGLTVVAPGLPEAEVKETGIIAVTLLRAVGWLSLPGLSTRPQIAGPIVATPGAQCLGRGIAQLHLLEAPDARAATDAEIGLCGVIAGPSGGLPSGTSLLELEPRSLVLTSFRPWERDRLMLRVMNPQDFEEEGTIRFGFPLAAVERVRLDGASTNAPFTFRFPELRFSIAPHQLATFVLSLPAER
jgi:hypothetical protein